MHPYARALLQVVLVVAAAIAALWLIHKLAPVVLVLIGSALLAYLVAPLVRWAERPVAIGARTVRLPRSAAIAVVYIGLAAVVGAAVVLLLPPAAEQIAGMVSAAPASTQSFLAWEHGWTRSYERLRIPVPLRRSIDCLLYTSPSPRD